MRISDWSSDVCSSDLCREDQIVEEVRNFCALADRIYKDFGFTYSIKLALRPEKRFGSDEMWDQAEAELREAVMAAGLATEEYGWEELPGEGAFYAPKLEWRSEEHTSELQSLMRISYAVFCLKKKQKKSQIA